MYDKISFIDKERYLHSKENKHNRWTSSVNTRNEGKRYATSLREPTEEEIIEFYHMHATSEQFHSEIKTVIKDKIMLANKLVKYARKN